MLFTVFHWNGGSFLLSPAEAFLLNNLHELPGLKYVNSLLVGVVSKRSAVSLGYQRTIQPCSYLRLLQHLA